MFVLLSYEDVIEVEVVQGGVLQDRLPTAPVVTAVVCQGVTPLRPTCSPWPTARAWGGWSPAPGPQQSTPSLRSTPEPGI